MTDKDFPNTVLEAALDYAKRGWHIFPIIERSKFPLGELVPHGVLDATTDPDKIKEWYRRFPNANIGVNCGKSKIAGVDVDNKPGRDGFYNWQTLCGKLKIDDTTITSRTGSGGMHLFFRAPDGVKLKATIGSLGEGIDTRTGNGYLVLPPSIHENGKPYEWELEFGLDFPIAPLPEPLIELIQNGKRPKIEVPVDGKIPEGQREEYLCTVAGALRRYGATPAEIEESLTILAKRCEPGTAPITPKDIRRMAYSIGSKPPAISYNNDIEWPNHVTDLGNAKSLVALHGKELRFCHGLDKWMLWDGTRWGEDKSEQIRRYADKTLKHILHQAVDLQDSKEKTDRIRKALYSQQHSRVNGMLAEAQSLLPVFPNDLDTHPYLFNCQNGTINLRTGELQEHDPQEMHSKISQVKYDPQANCDRWLAFISEIMCGDTELIRYLQKVVGYSLTANISERCFFILHGTGANGKSTFINTIINLLGEYGLQTPTSTLMAKKETGIPNDIARLKSARFVSACEAEQGRNLAESLIKQLTGGDRVSARFLQKEFFDFDPVFKLFLSTNHKPRIRGTDNAIWSRIRLIPFGYTVKVEDQDKDLSNKLLDELPGIFRWAIDGCLGWQKEGIKPPEAVKHATANYRMEMDVLGNFIDDRCEVDPDGEALASDLYEQYKQWCVKGGEYQMTQTLFGRLLPERGFPRFRHTAGSKRTVYLGVRIGTTVNEYLQDTVAPAEKMG